MSASAAPAGACAPKAIIFDLLTALLDSWTAWAASTVTGTDDEGQRWREQYLELTYGCGVYKPYEELVLQSAKESEIEDPEGSAKRLREQNWDAIKPWSEAGNVLRRLKANGYLLGVVTNCSDEMGLRAVHGCEKAISTSGLGADNGLFRFDAVTTAEESGFYKPNRKPYIDVLHKLGVRPEEAIFVAGSAADVPGAASVGMQVVWHNRIGLPRKGNAHPLRESSTLDGALVDLL